MFKLWIRIGTDKLEKLTFETEIEKKAFIEGMKFQQNIPEGPSIYLFDSEEEAIRG